MARIEILISVLDTGNGWTFVRHFDVPPITIGGTTANDLQLRHPHISDRHAEITFGSDGSTITRLPEAGRIWADGVPLRVGGQAPLREGSVIVTGPFRLEVHFQPSEHGEDGEHQRQHGLTLDLSLSQNDDDLIPARELLIVFASAFLMLRKYLGTVGSSRLCTLSEAHEIVDYLMDPIVPDDRVNELGDALAQLVTRVARLAVPAERWPL